MLQLGVNIDHIATLRQARGVNYPCLKTAVQIVESAGATGITLHLREDRRHIQDTDVYNLKEIITTKMNLEMAATDEMIKIASDVKPEDVCIVPEKREELTTEGGLDVLGNQAKITELCEEMNNNNIITSLFVASDFKQIEASKKCGAKVVEIHTGHYANGLESLQSIEEGIKFAHSIGLQVNAGHGLTLENTSEIYKLAEVVELNIGHSIVARSIFVGLEVAIKEMLEIMKKARL
jgi:pyridoxine 5-phosphate synthase